MRLAIRNVLPNPGPHRVAPAGKTRCCALSERVSIGARWPEYQGCRNWEGLLDPLDENLKAEIIRYGKFVQVAYSALDLDTTSPSFATCRFWKQNLLSRCGLQQSGYLPTKHLHATSSIQLPAWVDRAPTWISKQSSWIGYVAISEDEEEVRRLGRRDVVIAFRGTVTCLEWLENMRCTLTHLPGGASSASASASDSDPMVGSGFWSLYTSSTPACRSLREEIHGEVRRILDKYRGEALSFTFTGHSLGAALAVITAHDVRTCFGQAAPVTVISFGGPRVGNRSFRLHVEAHGSKVLRIVNADDVITKVPGIVLEEDGQVEEISASWILARLREMRWLYDEVGLELRVSNRDSQFLGGHVGNVAKCHELDVYLDLVRGLAGATCPFKATAKRKLRSWFPPQASSWFGGRRERAARVG